MKFPSSQLRPAAVTLYAGLSDLLGRSVKLQQSRRIWTDPSSGIQTKANIFSIDRGISFQVETRDCGMALPTPSFTVHPLCTQVMLLCTVAGAACMHRVALWPGPLVCIGWLC